MRTNHTLHKLKWSVIMSAMVLSTATMARAPNPDALPFEDLQRFTAVIENIKNYYVEPTKDSKLLEDAIRGMLSGLDPHSDYMDPEEFAELKASTSGKFGGLGIEVTMEDGYVKVISPIDDTPASKSGIKAGDMIIKLDEQPVKGLTLKKAVDIMRGNKGSEIKLTIIRKTENKPLVIKLVRDIIKVKSVKSKLLEDQFGYLRISQFQAQTGEDLNNAIIALKKENKDKNLRGVILDLRNNPGGVLDASVKVSDLFLNRKRIGYDGVVVYTKGRLPGSEIKERANNGDMLNEAPIVVLVNGGSASASEIVAGALQDHKRALIVGTQTFGKGSVQTVLPLRKNAGLKLTTALYYTPSGRSIQAKGITPDVVIPELRLPEPKEGDQNWLSVKEADLEGHIVVNDESKKVKTTDDKDKKALAMTDYQLNEALNILKGMAILKNHHNSPNQTQTRPVAKLPAKS